MHFSYTFISGARNPAAVFQKYPYPSRAGSVMLRAMLNYIWAGLIVSAFGFALSSDVSDLTSDKFRNGESLDVSLSSRATDLRDRHEGRIAVELSIDPETFIEHYGMRAQLDRELAAATAAWDRNNPSRDRPEAFPPPPIMGETEKDIRAFLAEPLVGELVAGDLATEFVGTAKNLPEPWAAGFTLREDTVRFEITGLPEDVGRRESFAALPAAAEFAPVHFLKMRAITQAAFDAAKWTVMELALPLVGILALWLGMVKIADAGGLVNVIVKLIEPVLHPLFPDIPRGHPAIGMIALNLAANVLGLGSAATPMGLKAMEEMQKLNPEKDTATNSMCTFLAINTASVQIMPPATLVAVMGVTTGDLWLPILAVTGISLCIGIMAARSLQIMPVFTRTDPNRQQRQSDNFPANTVPEDGKTPTTSTDSEKGGDA